MSSVHSPPTLRCEPPGSRSRRPIRPVLRLRAAPTYGLLPALTPTKCNPSRSESDRLRRPHGVVREWPNRTCRRQDSLLTPRASCFTRTDVWDSCPKLLVRHLSVRWRALPLIADLGLPLCSEVGSELDRRSLTDPSEPARQLLYPTPLVPGGRITEIPTVAALRDAAPGRRAVRAGR
jgi:hypothetical protein